jgi:N-methylhydantoinase B
MANGEDGGNGHVILRPGTDREEVTGMIYESMVPGDVLINNSGGGGGWGNPFERDPQQVLEDVRNDYVSREAAQREYGVVIDPATMTVDAKATLALRQGS